MEDQHEHHHTIKGHLNPKTIIASVTIAVAAALVVYGSYNFYLSLNNYQLDTLLIRAQEAEQQKDYDTALSIRNQIAETDPKHPGNMLGLAHIYFLKQDYSAAIDLLTQYNDLFEPTADSELILGKIYLQQGKIDEAQAATENVLATDPSHIEAKFLLSLILLSNDTDKENGEKLLKEVVASPNATQEMLDFNTTWQEALQTKNEQYRKSLLTFGLLEVEQPYLALTVIEPVIDAVPQYRDAHYLLAVAYYQTDQFAEAERAVNNALKIDKDHAASKELKTAIEKELGEDTITSQPTPTDETKN